jgi:hypothetical protein
VGGSGCELSDSLRVAITVAGLFAPGPVSSVATRTFTEFAEQGDVQTTYTYGHRAGGEVSIDYRVTRPLGLRLAVVHGSRPGSAALVAHLPHPLYLGRPREARQELGSLKEGVTGFHLGLSWRRTLGRAGLDLFAGSSVVRVSADAAADDALAYTHAYPYDSVTLAPVAVQRVTRTRGGLHAGAALDLRIARGVGFSAQVRHVRASVLAQPPRGSAVTLDGGGVDLSFGLRFSR